MLVGWNDTTRAYPRDKTMAQLFEEQGEQSPGAVAVEFEGAVLTYRRLNERANQLAHYLQSLGAGPDVVVAVCLERSMELVVALLGILKAGGAYVSLDATYPKERLAIMLADTQAPVVLTQQKLRVNCEAAIGELQSPIRNPNLVCLDTGWEGIARENLANPVGGATAEHLA